MREKTNSAHIRGVGKCCAVQSRITYNRGNTVAQPVLINREQKIPFTADSFAYCSSSITMGRKLPPTVHPLRAKIHAPIHTRNIFHPLLDTIVKRLQNLQRLSVYLCICGSNDPPAVMGHTPVPAGHNTTRGLDHPDWPSNIIGIQPRFDY